MKILQYYRIWRSALVFTILRDFDALLFKVSRYWGMRRSANEDITVLRNMTLCWLKYHNIEECDALLMKIPRSYGVWLVKKNHILTECDALLLRTYVSENPAALQLQDGPRRFGNTVTINTAKCLSVTRWDVRMSLVCPRVQSSVEDQNESGALVEWCWWGGNEVLGEKPVPFSLYRPKISHVFTQACPSDTSRWTRMWSIGGLGKYEVLEVKTVSMSLWSPQILHRLARDRGLVSAVARLSHDTAFYSSNSSQ